jgi:hypothetical protein
VRSTFFARSRGAARRTEKTRGSTTWRLMSLTRRSHPTPGERV